MINWKKSFDIFEPFSYSRFGKQNYFNLCFDRLYLWCQSLKIVHPEKQMCQLIVLGNVGICLWNKCRIYDFASVYVYKHRNFLTMLYSVMNSSKIKYIGNIVHKNYLY